MRCLPTQDGISKDERLEMETQPTFGRQTFQQHLSSVQRAQETVIHLVQQCPSTEARKARRILKSHYIRAKRDVPVRPHEILRRSEDAELRKIQDEGLYAFVESLNLDGLLMGQLWPLPTLDQSC